MNQLITTSFIFCIFFFSCKEQSKKEVDQSTPILETIKNKVKEDSIKSSDLTFATKYSNDSLNNVDEVQSCDCRAKPNQDIFCDTTNLSNSAQLFWYLECDSNAYCFKKNGQIKILKSGFDLWITSRTGLIFIDEYDNYLFFIHRWISGCCTPPDLVFLNKKSGEEIKRISNQLYVGELSDEHIALYFEDLTFRKLIVHNLKRDKKTIVQFEKDAIMNGIKSNEALDLSTVLYIENNYQDFINLKFKKSTADIDIIEIKK